MTVTSSYETIEGTDILERLANHQLLTGTPHAELAWLAAHGELRRYEHGTIVVAKGGPAAELFVMFSGPLAVYIDRGLGRRRVIHWHGAQITGLMPFSRLTHGIGDVAIEAAVELLAIHRRDFPELIRECPHVTETLVHAMLDRARLFTSNDWQDE